MPPDSDALEPSPRRLHMLAPALKSKHQICIISATNVMRLVIWDIYYTESRCSAPDKLTYDFLPHLSVCTWRNLGFDRTTGIEKCFCRCHLSSVNYNVNVYICFSMYLNNHTFSVKEN